MINGIKPIVSKKTKVGSNTSFDVAMNTFLDKLTDNVKSYTQKFDHMEKVVFKTDGGRKYIKVKYFTTNNGKEDKGRIHCFVDSTNGDIYKAATWRAPYTKGNNAVRGSIYDESCFEKTDLYGSWLYAK